MGFRKNAFATVWSIEARSDTLVNGRISISRKNKQTGEYETDFSGFVSFYGTATAKKAASLKEKDRIQLGDVDVTTKYDKEKDKTYTNFKVFNFSTQAEIDGETQSLDQTEPEKVVDDGQIDDNELPF